MQCRYIQSHYIEILQGGVSIRAIHNWLRILTLFFAPQKKSIEKFIKEMSWNFADTTMLLHFFCSENMKKAAWKVNHNGPYFFSVLPTGQNQPKSHILFQTNGSLRDFYRMTLSEKFRKYLLNSQDNKMSMQLKKIIDSIVAGNSLPPLD